MFRYDCVQGADWWSSSTMVTPSGTSDRRSEPGNLQRSVPIIGLQRSEQGSIQRSEPSILQRSEPGNIQRSEPFNLQRSVPIINLQRSVPVNLQT